MAHRSWFKQFRRSTTFSGDVARSCFSWSSCSTCAKPRPLIFKTGEQVALLDRKDKHRIGPVVEKYDYAVVSSALSKGRSGLPFLRVHSTQLRPLSPNLPVVTRSDLT